VRVEKQGWYEDPSSRHEYRWFSEGLPTALVADGQANSQDPIDIDDIEAYRDMELAQPPDDGPLLVQPSDKPPSRVNAWGASGIWTPNPPENRR
jgi:hypothetical protein